ncbi:ABC transporter [Lactobacillus sp. DCY120]|uniref:ABC transporter n=1 Tax=Bombilactobacillus apium TaxID=2675299 RepID=A0A850R6F5_9LACO|nr:ABC transporter [Bombilactobacillus apium]NVY96125.1 ABC transporter [Bombilactobacillus apium]
MTKLIQIKQVLRNKRFLMFTMFIPVTWYFLLYNLQHDLPPVMMLGVAVFIGIIGNSLATFSKRISSNSQFYFFQARISRYTIKNYFFDQGFVQLILNFLIFMVVLLAAVIFFHLKLEFHLFEQFGLLMVMGLYFSAIGFVMGVRLDSKIIDTVSFPIIIIAAMTIIPFDQIGSGDFIHLISKIQMIFPGYYYNNLMQAIIDGKAVNYQDVLLFIATIGLNILPLYFLIPKERKSASND